MVELLQVYKCEVCGNIVEVLHVGGGQLVCCGKPMRLFKENTVEASLEKHIPVLETNEDEALVKVGSVAHPMEEKHYIEWIQVETKDGKVYKKFLKPGDKPEASFKLCKKCIEEGITTKAYCNLHGLWKK